MDWLLHVLGIDNVSGYWYAFWSGFAGDIALIGAGLALVRKHNCHVHRCWRIGRLKHEDWVVCHKHHPAGPPKADEIRVTSS